jgi:hypothetical protein
MDSGPRRLKNCRLHFNELLARNPHNPYLHKVVERFTFNYYKAVHHETLIRKRVLEILYFISLQAGQDPVTDELRFMCRDWWELELLRDANIHKKSSVYDAFSRTRTPQSSANKQLTQGNPAIKSPSLVVLNTRENAGPLLSSNKRQEPWSSRKSAYDNDLS